MRNRIICRFENKEDFDLFCKKNQLELLKETKEYNVHTKERKDKKQILKSNKEKTEYWEEHWKDMPLYESVKQEEYAKIEFIFNEDDLELAKKIFEQPLSNKSTSVWFPKLEQGKHSKFRVIGGDYSPKYPIYVVSKNRSDKCFTSRFLTQMEVYHYVVVEPQDFELYKQRVENKYAKILKLDMRYKDNYDTFDELGDSKPKGPGGARNFCWEHSINNKFEWHWVFDDNTTEGFHWMYKNQKIKCRTGSYFRAIEDFIDRYNNIAIAGLNYSMFCKMCDKTPAFVMNTRIYSFLLIRNDIPYRWRGRYNEDTDLSLRVLKDGWCTVQFNAFLAAKLTTQKIKGGNTDEFYAKEGTLNKSMMLKEMHPDVTEVVWKFSRWHHQVDYSGFKQELIFKEGVEKNYEVNEHGMKIVRIPDEIVGTDKDNRKYIEEHFLDNVVDENIFL